MKRLLYLPFLIILPALVHAGTDTLTAYLNNARKVTTEANPAYIRKAWKEGNLWHVKYFRTGTMALAQDLFFADESFTRRQEPLHATTTCRDYD